MVCRLNLRSSCSLMRAQTPSPNSVPFGTTTAARPGARAGLSELRMMNCRNSSAVSRGLHVARGSCNWMPASSSPPKGGLVTMTS